jgi:hypothetical protein
MQNMGFQKNTFFYQTVLILLSAALTLAAGEFFIRLVYPDGGRRISNAPGNKRIEYLLSAEGKRGPSANNPKRPGVTRILIQGDSITFGVGVRDWKELYPFRLLRLHQQDGKTVDMETLAEAGREIDGHRQILSQFGERLHPDIIIYQWYVNDLEIRKEGRPVNRFLFWRYFSFHETMMDKSYLYNFLDKKLENLLPHSGRNYTQYLLEDYNENTPGWFLFRLEFHNWATLAKVFATRRILMMYPSLPYRGAYPLKPIHDRVAGLANAPPLTFPAIWTDRGVGDEVQDPASPWGASLRVHQGKTPAGIVFSTQPIYLERGNHGAIFRLRGGRLAPRGTLKLKVLARDRVVVEKTVEGKEFVEEGAWQEVKVPFSLDQRLQNNIRFQVDYLGQGEFEFDSIRLPVAYTLEVLDLLPYLKDSETHVSPFDAHPNPETHRIMADALYRQLTKIPALSISPF